MLEKRRLPGHQLHVPISFGFGVGTATDVSAVRTELRQGRTCIAATIDNLTFDAIATAAAQAESKGASHA